MFRMIGLSIVCGLYSITSQANDSIAWRSVFTEPQLVNLIETALERNADLRTAHINVVQAEAQLKAARLAFLPSLTVGAEGTLTKTKGQQVQRTYNVPATRPLRIASRPPAGCWVSSVSAWDSRRLARVWPRPVSIWPV